MGRPLRRKEKGGENPSARPPVISGARCFYVMADSAMSSSPTSFPSENLARTARPASATLTTSAGRGSGACLFLSRPPSPAKAARPRTHRAQPQAPSRYATSHVTDRLPASVVRRPACIALADHRGQRRKSQ